MENKKLPIFLLLTGIALLAFACQDYESLTDDYSFLEKVDPYAQELAMEVSSEEELSTKDSAQDDFLKVQISSKIHENLSSSKNEHIKRIMDIPEAREILLGNIEPTELIESGQPMRAYYEASVEIINELTHCLKDEELCGQREILEKPGEYFNPHRTSLHKAVQVALAVVNLSAADGEIDHSDFSKEALRDALQVEASEIPISATQLLLSDKSRQEDNFDTVVNESYNMDGQVKSNVMILMANSEQAQAPESRERFLKSLAYTLSDKSDTYTASELQKNLVNMKLSEKEFKAQAKQVCKLKPSLRESGHWLAIYKSMTRQIRSMDYNLIFNCQ